MIFDAKKPIGDKQLREYVISLVISARQRLPKNFTSTDVAEQFNLSIVLGQMDLKRDGAYIADHRKIIINTQITSLERRHFTLCHELSHHLIREDDDLYEYLHEQFSDDHNFDRALEMLCNIGSAEFVFPKESALQYIGDTPFSLNIIPKICTGTLISGPAALFQIIQNAPHKCYGVICDIGSPRDTSLPNQGTFASVRNADKLFVHYSIWSPSVEYSMARFTIVPKEHVLQRGLETDELIHSVDRIPFRSQKSNWKVPCEVLGFRGSVYGLFNVKPPDSHNQLRLF